MQKALTAIKKIAFWTGTHLLLLTPCTAQPLPPPSPSDVALLAATCATCHGPGGRPPQGAPHSIPALRGKDSATLLRRMQAFKATAVPDATVMPLLMQGYDTAQMQALAQWFADPATEAP